ncbi:hypothetical protein [Henriciella sp.]|uniref:hypothetical protein n=1 Tax=Henriciella sp. TaxID=1968823 RepID=UPI0017DC579E|nr:hypothetical protein [Henriciella sp.]HIG21935.1 hypothetical protein [Henriciella sp.]
MGRAKHEMQEHLERLELMKSALVDCDYLGFCERHENIYGGDSNEIEPEEVSEVRQNERMVQFSDLNDADFKSLADQALSDAGWNE